MTRYSKTAGSTVATTLYALVDSVPFMCATELRVARALDNTRKAISMHEAFERVSLRNHGSFLPHGAVFKVSRDILLVGDVWAVDLSPLELQNAVTKRVANSNGSKRLVFGAPGFARTSLKSDCGGTRPTRAL